jgi:hypothetical protein
VAQLNEEYIAAMEDTLGTYEEPYNSVEPVVCLDEKPVTLHADLRAPIPAKPGRPAKRDNEYERRGTANVFGAIEPKTGRHFTTATRDRSGAEFARIVRQVVDHYPFATTIISSWITSVPTVANRWAITTANDRAATCGID